MKIIEKKHLCGMIGFLTLFTLFLIFGSLAEESQPLRITMLFSRNTVTAGDTIQIAVAVQNISGEDFTEPMRLYDPDDQLIEDFGSPMPKSRETVTWFGNWTVTEEQLKAGKIIYTLRYTMKNEDGKATKKALRLGKSISRSVEADPDSIATPSPSPNPTASPESLADVLLYRIFRPNPSTGQISLTCVDADGNLWYSRPIWEKGSDWPIPEDKILETLKTREGMELVENLIGGTFHQRVLDGSWFLSLKEMARSASGGEGRPRKTGIDIGEESVYALRGNPDGSWDSVLLGMAGSSVYENTNPEAQMMFEFMWDSARKAEGVWSETASFGFGNEAVAPHGYEPVTARAFFGLPDEGLETATITALDMDCEGGPIEVELTSEEAEQIRTLALRGIVIGKWDCHAVTGGTRVYTFHNTAGNILGEMETFDHDTLAVAGDGMYLLSQLPRPVEELEEDEQQLLSFQIEGVDYVVGRSTPRDLIRNGWKVWTERDGTFSFTDAEGLQYIYVTTRGGSMDEPILDISCQFAPDVAFRFCGFDGYVHPKDPEDPDTVWYIRMTDVYDLVPLEDREEAVIGPWWDGMESWLKEEMGGIPKDNGVQMKRTLSDGRILSVHCASAPAYLALYEPGELTDPEEDW